MSLPPGFVLLVDTAIAREIMALLMLVIVAAAVLGHFLEEIVVEFLLRISILIMICLMIYMAFGLMGFYFKPPSNSAEQVARAEKWANAGLVIAAIVAVELGASSGKKDGTSEPGKRRGAMFFRWLWIGLCFASWIGHVAGGWVGLLTITVPAVLIF